MSDLFQQTSSRVADPLELLKRYWGYNAFRPLQGRAIERVLAGRDQLLVLPTGGGKSLCYQLPALVLPGTAVIVSPLIALMKDQVDSLRAMGIGAGMLASSQDMWEQREVRERLVAGDLKLLYVSPERLISGGTVELLAGLEISFIAVDEAHCISHWGHDFRPEYRKLASLREKIPVAMHGFTATATERVRKDICRQLNLRDPEVMVGNFDRPNLTYRFVQRTRAVIHDLDELLKAQKGNAGIVYCIRRKDVEETVTGLLSRGHKAAGYHAGMEAEDRTRIQEDFKNERLNIIVATVAFGMGIDRPDVRFVVHTGLPKSIEHYQQEAGRAGRDGLPAECRLYYAPKDMATWKFIFGNMEDVKAEKAALDMLNELYRLADGATCRHAGLVSYFGQELGKENCGACDICLNEREVVKDSATIALKILSAVVRTGERFGGDYLAHHLQGKATDRMKDNGHDALSTYGLLPDEPLTTIRTWIDQLESQGYLTMEEEFKTFKVSGSGRRLLKERNLPVTLLVVPKKKKDRKAGPKSTAAPAPGSEALFERLREVRRALATKLGYPPYVIFHDKTLWELAARQPQDVHAFRLVEGVGDQKAKKYGETFVGAIRKWSEEQK